MLNLIEFSNYIKNTFKNKLTDASVALNIAKSTLSLILNKKRNCGLKTLGKIKEYCEKAEIDFNFFIH